jgi:hypothetical protein
MLSMIGGSLCLHSFIFVFKESTRVNLPCLEFKSYPVKRDISALCGTQKLVTACKTVLRWTRCLAIRILSTSTCGTLPVLILILKCGILKRDVL